MSPQCHVRLFLTCAVTETSQRDRNKLEFAGGGDVGLKLCCSFRNTIQSNSRRETFFLFFCCFYLHLLKSSCAKRKNLTGKGLLYSHCYMWSPPCLVSEHVLSTGWNAACWWLNYSKPPTCPKVETDHSSRPGHFIKSMLLLFMSDIRL